MLLKEIINDKECRYYCTYCKYITEKRYRYFKYEDTDVAVQRMMDLDCVSCGRDHYGRIAGGCPYCAKGPHLSSRHVKVPLELLVMLLETYLSTIIRDIKNNFLTTLQRREMRAYLEIASRIVQRKVGKGNGPFARTHELTDECRLAYHFFTELNGDVCKFVDTAISDYESLPLEMS